MADNYLEKRFEDLAGKSSSGKAAPKKTSPSLNTLLYRNRSCRGYDKSYVVGEEELKTIIQVNTLVASARNQQALRFHPVTKDSGAGKVLPLIRLGGALPQLHLPLEGTEPEAFIIVCGIVPEDRFLDVDLGISLQSMALKAVEMGLRGIIIGSFDRAAVKETFSLGYDPLAILAIGKGSEDIYLRPIRADESHAYYRKDGIHYVPKVCLDDLLI